jgi:hypothetical protein
MIPLFIYRRNDQPLSLCIGGKPQAMSSNSLLGHGLLLTYGRRLEIQPCKITLLSISFFHGSNSLLGLLLSSNEFVSYLACFPSLKLPSSTPDNISQYFSTLTPPHIPQSLLIFSNQAPICHISSILHHKTQSHLSSPRLNSEIHLNVSYSSSSLHSSRLITTSQKHATLFNFDVTIHNTAFKI